MITALVGAIFSLSAAAQNYPVKPIRFIIGFPPSGTNDIVARMVAPKMAEFLGQQVVVENRGGASTMIATEAVARAAPDGYTILLNAPAHSTNPTLAKPQYDSVRDFAFISLVAESQNLLVQHLSFPPRSVKELIAFSKQRPGEINFGSSGVGSTPHLSAELFQYMTGVKWVHVPYKGSGLGMVALLSGEVSFYFANIPAAIQHVRNGKLRPIALSGSRRTSAVLGIPTLAESGLPGFEVTSWFGIAAPAKTPRAIIEQLNSAIVRAVNAPDMRTRLQDQGADPVGNSPEQYTAFIEREIAKWAKVIKAAGIKGV
ncbi:MAG: tripartite tricarboxylate transporter substrate binding protein [Burkholderiales bacterium]